MRLTIAVLLLCKCLIFELVISEETCDLGAIEERLKALETSRDKAKVAFSASLGSNGFSGPVTMDTTLVYKNVVINVGEAYDPATGIFTAPVRGVYYFSFFYHCGIDNPTVLILYRNEKPVALTKHHSQKVGKPMNGGNGLTLLLETEDKVYIVLQRDSWIWDTDSVTVFSGFLIDTM